MMMESNVATPSSFISPDQCTALDEDKSPSPKKRSFDDIMNESSQSYNAWTAQNLNGGLPSMVDTLTTSGLKKKKISNRKKSSLGKNFPYIYSFL